MLNYAYQELVDSSRISSDLIPKRSLLVVLVLELPTSRTTAGCHRGKKSRLIQIACVVVMTSPEFGGWEGVCEDACKLERTSDVE